MPSSNLDISRYLSENFSTSDIYLFVDTADFLFVQETFMLAFKSRKIIGYAISYKGKYSCNLYKQALCTLLGCIMYYTNYFAYILIRVKCVE